MKTENPLYLEMFDYMKEYVYRYSEKPFLLASGKESNHYFNCKEITLHPERLSRLSQALIELVIEKNLGIVPESIGGLTLGADPISYGLALSYAQKSKIVYPLVVRKEIKNHGTQKRIEGYFQKVKTCLVVDDVITTGGSTLKAVEALREAGIEVRHGICILDREEGGWELLKENGIEMFSLFKKSDFF